MQPMLRLLLLLCVTLSCSLPALDVLTPIAMPAPMAVDNSVPVALKLGEIRTQDDMVLLTPQQAANLAAQVKYFRQAMIDSYMLGRAEGEAVAGALTMQLRHSQAQGLRQQQWWLRACVGAVLLGAGIGASLTYTLAK